MVQLTRVRVQINTIQGGLGVSTFYSIGPLSIVPALQTFWAAMATKMPTGTSVQVESSGDLIDDATGDITGAWSEAAVAGNGGAIDGSFAAPAGACVSWRTNDIVHSHRVRGRTFVVPLGGSQYQNDGSLADAAKAQMVAAADALIASGAGALVVWSRPFLGTPATATRPANPARGGTSHVVTSSSVRDKAAVLRSRRD